ncbi:hypothetical protein [Streptomyces sp. NPDC088350]|uniref:hypothetical protein n=1 Tax=Streptomyces sp. NPDC088350 TaxID=3365854 RepID=UPI00382F392E
MLGFAASEAGGRFRDSDPDEDMAVAEQLVVRLRAEGWTTVRTAVGGRCQSRLVRMQA